MLKLIVTAAAAALALAASVAEATPLISFSTPSATKNKYHSSAYGSSCYSYDWAKFGDVDLIQSDMTNLVCANYCGDSGYKYAGTQGSTCRCSNAAPSSSSSSILCFNSCPGDWTDTCGGLGSLDVWINADIGASSSSSATKTSAASSSSSTSTKASATSSTTSSSTSSTSSTKPSSTSSTSSARSSSTSSTSSSSVTSVSSSASSSSSSATSAASSNSSSSSSSASSVSSSTSSSSSSAAPSSTYVPFKYQAKLYEGGCFTDAAGSGNPRTFGGAYTASGTSMTNEMCANYCGDKAFKYSGIEYGQECMCSNQAPTVTAGATCNMPCTGNANQTCGGLWAMTVFDNVAIKAPVSDVSTLSSNYQSLGCFADQVGSHGRTLNSLTFNSVNMTISTCTAKCSAEGYPYAGLEYSDQCWCGNFAPLATSTACNMACSGNSADNCGGPNALAVYFNNDLSAKANPTPSCGSLPQGYSICKWNGATCTPIDA